MSRNYPPPSGIGNIATAITEFANGFRQAKSQKQQQEDKERESLHRQADDMLGWAKVLPATEHAKLLENYARLKDMADAPTAKTKQKPGIGNLILRMFGGGQEVVPNTGVGPNTQMIQGMKDRYHQQKEEDSLRGPAPEPGRGDYGSDGMANFLGPAAEAPQRPTMPAAPQEQPWNRPQYPKYSSLVDAQGDFNPTESAGSVADQSIQRAMPSPVAQFSQPAQGSPQNAATASFAQPSAPSPVQTSAAQMYQSRQAQPTSIQRPQAPHPSQVLAQARQQAVGDWTGAIDEPKLQNYLQTQGAETLARGLETIDAFLDSTPGPDTVQDIQNNPVARAALDMIQSYEDYGIIAKGTIERNLGRRTVPYKAPDANKFSLTEGAGPDGKPGYFNYNSTAGTLAPIPGAPAPYKAPPVPTPLSPSASAYQAAYQASLKPAAQRTPEENAAIAAYQNVERMGQAPKQPNMTFRDIQNPATGRWELAEVTEGNPQPRFTGFPTMNQFDINSLRLPTEQYPTDASGAQNTYATPVKVYEWDPALVKNAMRNKQITADMISGIIIPSIKNAAVKAELEQFLRNPFSSPIR